MNVEIRDDRFRDVVGDDAPVEEVAGGFDLTEGPVWHPVEKHLIFSDMPGNIMRNLKRERGFEPSDSIHRNGDAVKESVARLTSKRHVNLPKVIQR